MPYNFQDKKQVKAKIPIVTRLLTYDDIDEYCKTSNCTRDEPLTRFKDGHLCWCAFHEKKLASYIWRGVNKMWISNLKTFIMPPKELYYSYDAFTHPDYRGLHIYSELLSTWSIYAREHTSFTGSFSLVSPDNTPSLKASQNVGNMGIGTIKTRLFFGFPLHSVECKTVEDLEWIKSLVKLNLINVRVS